MLYGEVRVDRADARVIQAGGNRIRFLDLSVLVLHDQGTCPVDDALFTQLDRGGAHAGVDTLAAGLGQDDLHPLVVHEMIDRTGGVTSPAYAGDQVIRVIPSFLLQQLLLDLLADNGLQPGYHIRIRMGAYRRTDNIIRIRRMTAPVTDRLVRGVFQGHVSRGHGHDGSSQHFHLLYVGMLAFHVCLPHINDTFHIHQGTYRSRSHSMLSGTRLGDDTGLPHAAG